MCNRAIGTCSNCGGRVSQPHIHFGVQPPIPACESCGARMAQPHGPIVPMEPRPNRSGLPDYLKNAPTCDKRGASPERPMFGPGRAAPGPTFIRDHWRPLSGQGQRG